MRRIAVVKREARAAVGLRRLAGSETLSEHIPVAISQIEGTTDRMRNLELVADIETSQPQQNRLRIRLAIADGESISLREARERMRQISPEAIERFRPIGGGEPDVEVGSLDRGLLGCQVQLAAKVESLPGIQLERHQVILSWPESLLPLAVSEGFSNSSEATAVIEIAAAHPYRRFVVTSPYRAQCHLIAEGIYARNLTNTRVRFSERLGHRAVQPDTDLIVSLVATDRQSTSGWPLNELGRLVPLFVGEWAKIHVVCSGFVSEHHPLVRQPRTG